jgi:hypothetical protein
MMNIAFMNTALIVTWILGASGIAPAQGAKNPDPMPGASKDECVFVRDISNWRVLDSRNVVLFSPNQRHAYLMQLSAPVSDLKYSFKVAFIDRDRDGQLCGRSLDKVQAVDSLIRQPATIMGMTRLNEAGLAALEAQYNVKLTRKREETKSPDTH